LRVGRGVLISLPAIGGVFGLYLLRSDLRRAQEEWERGSQGTSSLFAGAGAADLTDAVLHFSIAYSLLAGLGHDVLANLEQVSIGCAIVSTVFAVVGEVLSSRRRKGKN